MKQVTVFLVGEVIVGDIEKINNDGIFIINIKSKPYTDYKEIFISNTSIKMIAWHKNKDKR